MKAIDSLLSDSPAGDKSAGYSRVYWTPDGKTEQKPGKADPAPDDEPAEVSDDADEPTRPEDANAEAADDRYYADAVSALVGALRGDSVSAVADALRAAIIQQGLK